MSSAREVPAASTALNPKKVESSGRSLDTVKDTQGQSWWISFVVFFLSGLAWVMSIPILTFLLGGALRPHLGWPLGVLSAVLMFSVCVQIDQRIATLAVFVVGSTSACMVETEERRATAVFAIAATCLTSLNAIPKVCRFIPQLLHLQCKSYSGYQLQSELRGDFDTIQPGNSFFACHPHGVLSIGWISNVVWNQRFHLLAGPCFYLVDKTLRNKGLFARIWFDAFEGPHGGFRDNRRETIQNLMKRGESVSMIPGAYQEATLFSNSKDRVALSQRKGFIKYCLQYGYRLHPVYTFGETDTYSTLNCCEAFRLWLNSFGIPTVAFWGMTLCPFMPRPARLFTYVGAPLEMPKIDKPTEADVDEWHAKYRAALRGLFDKHKAEVGRADSHLEIV